MSNKDLADYLRKRFEKAEGRVLKDQFRPKEEKKDWLTTHCIHCGYRIQYVPTEEWKGRLKCPDCGKIFDVPAEDDQKGPTLDDFSERKGKKEDEDSR